MRRLLSIISIVFGLTVLIASTSRRAMKWISQHREHAPKEAWWAERKTDTLGDLIRMGYLANVHRFRDTTIHKFVKAGSGQQKTDLYIWGDSYVLDIPDSVFYGLHAYHYGRRDYQDLVYHLDRTKNNILVLELGERFLRAHFAFVSPVFNHVYKASTDVSLGWSIPKPMVMRAGFNYPNWDVKCFFNEAINQNIEYNLFSYNEFTPVRNFKAEINAIIFERGSGDVVIAEDGSRLLLRNTLGPKGLPSSFSEITGEEWYRLINNLNTIYDHYRQEGFNEVYLSVIPSPASLIQPQGYNMLIPQIEEQHMAGNLKMPIINVYNDYLKEHNPGAYYLRGDTHWNDSGMQVWIKKMNGMLHAWDTGSDYKHEW